MAPMHGAIRPMARLTEVQMKNTERKLSQEELQKRLCKRPVVYIALPPETLLACGKWVRLLVTAFDPKGEWAKRAVAKEERQ